MIRLDERILLQSAFFLWSISLSYYDSFFTESAKTKFLKHILWKTGHTMKIRETANYENAIRHKHRMRGKIYMVIDIDTNK